MKYRILEFKDGYAVEPRFEGEKWFTKRNGRYQWELKKVAGSWIFERWPGGKYTTPLLPESKYQIEKIPDTVKNWKYYK